MADAAPSRVLVVPADAGLDARVAAALGARRQEVNATPQPGDPVDPPAVVAVDHLSLPSPTPGLVLFLLPGGDDEAASLAAYADDVLAGPLWTTELASRVVLLARGAGAGSEPHSVGPISVDAVGRRVALAGRPLELTRREFELLAVLAAAPGRVFTKQELLHAIWGAPPGLPTRRLDTLVSRLRGRLGEQRGLLVTVWGIGYRLGR